MGKTPKMIKDIKAIITDIKLLLILALYTICNILGYTDSNRYIIAIMCL